MNLAQADKQAIYAAEAAGYSVPEDLCSMTLADMERIPGVGKRRARRLASAVFREVPVVVITRHPALVTLLRKRGLIPGDRGDGYCAACALPRQAGIAKWRCICQEPRVIAKASLEDVKGARVIGTLPMHLAAHAACVTEVPLALSPKDRGRELTVKRLQEIAGAAVTYRVAVVP